MTLQEAISITDEMKPNMMSQMLKYKYLTDIEQLIHEEIVLRHEHPAALDVKPVYTEDSDPTTELVVPDPYSQLYVDWLTTKIDRQNQEDARFNIDMMHFNQAYQTMSEWWTRTHTPLQKNRELKI